MPFHSFVIISVCYIELVCFSRNLLGGLPLQQPSSKQESKWGMKIAIAMENFKPDLWFHKELLEEDRGLYQFS